MNPKAKALYHFIFLSNTNGNNMPAGNRRNILRTTSSNNSLLPVAISYHDQNGINSYVCIPFEVLVKTVEANTTTRKKMKALPLLIEILLFFTVQAQLSLEHILFIDLINLPFFQYIINKLLKKWHRQIDISIYLI